jgi:uncharacterized protein
VSALTVRTARAVADFPWWDELAAPAGLYQSAHWLRHTEAVFDQWYLAIVRGAEVLAAAACCLAPKAWTLNRLTEPRWLFSSSPTNDMPEGFDEEPLYPYLACGAPSLHNYRLLVRPELDRETRAGVIAALVEAVRAIARDAGAKVIGYPFLPTPDIRELRAVDPNAVPCFVGGAAVLDIAGGFAGYLERFRSKDRWSVLRDIKRAEEAQLTFDVRPIGAVLDASVPLLAVNHERHHIPFEAERVRKIIEGWLVIGDDALATCAWRADQLVGVALFLRHGQTLNAILVGSLAELEKRASVYFNTLFYEAVRFAERTDIKAIHYGTSSLAAKVSRGCRLAPLWSLLQPVTAWPAGAQEMLAAGNRFRVDEDMQELVPRWGEARTKQELGWDELEAMLQS